MTQPYPTDDERDGPPPLPSWQAPAPVPGATDPTADPALRAMALKRLEETKEFRIHLTVYVAVMTFLVAVWAVSGMGYFWPIWPMMAWGLLGVGLHGASLRWEKEPTEEQIAEQVRRIAEQRRGPAGGPGRLEGPRDTV